MTIYAEIVLYFVPQSGGFYPDVFFICFRNRNINTVPSSYNRLLATVAEVEEDMVYSHSLVHPM
jgi:hypothetical protein